MFACFEQARRTFSVATVGDFGDPQVALEEVF